MTVQRPIWPARMRTWRLPLLVLLAAIPAHRLHAQGATVQSVPVPSVVSRDLNQARRLLEAAHLRLGQVDNVVAPNRAGTIIRQSPQAKSLVPAGTAVDVVVATSSGTQDGPVAVAESASVPDLKGSDRTVAAFRLGLAHLVGGQTDSIPDEEHAGQVVRQSPGAGARVPRGSAVALWFGYGVPVVVPDVRGSSLDDASRAIAAARLRVGRVDSAGSEGEPGLVARQRPGAGESVRAGSDVRLTIRSHPLQIIVPDLVGNSPDLAAQKIGQAGLSMGPIEWVEGDGPAGVIVSQDPVAGASVAPATPVTLRETRAVALVSVPNVVGRPVYNAIGTLKGAGLTPGVVDSVRRQAGAGAVVAQEPAAASQVARGASVALTVAIAPASVAGAGEVGPAVGPAPLTMPNLVGRTRKAATAMVQAIGLAAATIEPLESDSAPDRVLAQVPATGAPVRKGAHVTLQVSAIRLVLVPNLVGRAVAAAESLVPQLRLQSARVDSSAAANQAGLVLRQDPAAKARVAPGTRIYLWVGVRPFNWIVLLTALVGLGGGAAAAPSVVREVKDRRWRRRMRFESGTDAGRQVIVDAAGPVAGSELQLVPHSDRGTQSIAGTEPLGGN
jgi:beta-lactam-binding protein with PASTA domain